jgi:predicted AAA+ superfamily ATPase
VRAPGLQQNLGDYGRFLELAAVESGKAVNLTKISQESGVPISTVRGFYQVLEDTLMGFSLPPYQGSGRSRILKTRKFYFFDVGVRNAVARLPLDRRLLAIEGGHLLEHWVGCELMARLGYLGRSWRLSFWRTTDGAEVDYVLETPKEVIPIEARFTQNPRPADAAGIEHFITRHPGRVKRGYLVCRSRRPEQLSRHVMAIPWESL